MTTEMLFCQSCGMPMGSADLYGTEKDGAANSDWCVYCYKDGAFVGGECTLEQMIDTCVPFMLEGAPDMTEEMARKMLSEQLPGLKRWKK